MNLFFALGFLSIFFCVLNFFWDNLGLEVVMVANGACMELNTVPAVPSSVVVTGDIFWFLWKFSDFFIFGFFWVIMNGTCGQILENFGV